MIGVLCVTQSFVKDICRLYFWGKAFAWSAYVIGADLVQVKLDQTCGGIFFGFLFRDAED
jgi:hypothetical protein